MNWTLSCKNTPMESKIIAVSFYSPLVYQSFQYSRFCAMVASPFSLTSNSPTGFEILLFLIHNGQKYQTEHYYFRASSATTPEELLINIFYPGCGERCPQSARGMMSWNLGLNLSSADSRNVLLLLWFLIAHRIFARCCVSKKACGNYKGCKIITCAFFCSSPEQVLSEREREREREKERER